MGTVQLGDLARDLVTGFEGICVARTEWLNGCIRVLLQPKMGADGKVPDNMYFDEPQVEVVQPGVVPVGPRDPGGPLDAPKRIAAPTR